MIVSGFGFSKETMMIYDELENAFLKATLACAKKCRTIQYGIVEPCLVNAYHEIAEKGKYYGHLKSAVGITREKSLEAIKICKAPPASTPPKLVSLPLSAKKYLQDKFNISNNRIIIKGYGSKKTIADNQTKEGHNEGR
jgi:hypothetical protein